MGSAGRGGKRGRTEGPPAKRIGAKHRRDDDLVRALDHWLRREIMRLLHASETPLGIDEITEELDQTSARIRHHMQVLRRRALIALVDADAEGNAFYVSRIKDQAAVTVFLEQADKANAAT